MGKSLKTVGRAERASEHGFTMTEMLIAVMLTTVVMSSVFALLHKGQEGFRREPEVSDLNTNARSGMEMVARDLVLAGNGAPPSMAVLWVNGGGINPDSITILYTDPEVPLSEPITCAAGGGPCKTIDNSSTLDIDPTTFDPAQANPEKAYSKGMILFALETSDCNGDGQIGIYPFEVTQDPLCTGAGGGGPADCTTLNVNHNPGNGVTGLNQPQGFNEQVLPDCALIGRFRAIQYRINPPPPTASPSLERRDLGAAGPWIPVARNIENLQFQYAQGSTANFLDAPGQPDPGNPESWITRVRVVTAGRSQSNNLQGASAGVFSQADTFVRQTFSTVVNLRNVSAAGNPSTGGTYN